MLTVPSRVHTNDYLSAESSFLTKGVGMRSWFERTGLPALIGFIAAILLLIAPAITFAQGGEPRYFAIRGARVVPVSGPAMDDATIVVACRVIVAVAKDSTI